MLLLNNFLLNYKFKYVSKLHAQPIPFDYINTEEKDWATHVCVAWDLQCTQWSLFCGPDLIYMFKQK